MIDLNFRLLGTPTEKQWGGVTTLRDWHAYPQWEPQNLARAVPALGPDGVDLLSVTHFFLFPSTKWPYYIIQFPATPFCFYYDEIIILSQNFMLFRKD